MSKPSIAGEAFDTKTDGSKNLVCTKVQELPSTPILRGPPPPVVGVTPANATQLPAEFDPRSPPCRNDDFERTPINVRANQEQDTRRKNNLLRTALNNDRNFQNSSSDTPKRGELVPLSNNEMNITGDESTSLLDTSTGPSEDVPRLNITESKENVSTTDEHVSSQETN